ncbi:MAG: hypothetical protein OXFUSZZB_000186 [Candidatus Fervidibacter sp.]
MKEVKGRICLSLFGDKPLRSVSWFGVDG